MDQMFSGGAGWIVSQYQLVGPVGALLLLLSLISLTLIFLKLITLARLGRDRSGQVEEALEKMESEGLMSLLQALGKNRHPIADMLRSGTELALAGQPRGIIEAEVRAIANHHLARLSRYNRVLELIGLLAPLLGLLGTILGMIKAFAALQQAGAQADPAILAGGIWEALLTTAIGLVVAIPAIAAFNLIESRIDNLRQQASSSLGRYFARLERLVA